MRVDIPGCVPQLPDHRRRRHHAGDDRRQRRGLRPGALTDAGAGGLRLLLPRLPLCARLRLHHPDVSRFRCYPGRLHALQHPPRADPHHAGDHHPPHRLGDALLLRIDPGRALRLGGDRRRLAAANPAVRSPCPWPRPGWRRRRSSPSSPAGTTSSSPSSWAPSRRRRSPWRRSTSSATRRSPGA